MKLGMASTFLTKGGEMIVKERVNGDYGMFTISADYSSPYYPVRIMANHHFSVHKTIDEAISYLIGRFGCDVVYNVK